MTELYASKHSDRPSAHDRAEQKYEAARLQHGRPNEERMRHLLKKGGEELGDPASMGRYSCLTLNRASKQLPFRVHPVL
jgi:hypothetical protein